MVVRLGLGARTVEYNAGWELQRQIHERRVAGDAGDCCLLLEHDPVYTAGKRTRPEDRPAPGMAAAPVVDVDRGGRITWHGPGQLVGYPIIALNEPVDVIAYVRALEEAMIRTCADFGVTAARVEGRSGAWVTGGNRPDRKVGAIGIRVSRGVTMHGIALNCDNDLSWYGTFVPCGISDAGVTSLTAEAGPSACWPRRTRSPATSPPRWATGGGGRPRRRSSPGPPCPPDRAARYPGQVGW